MARILLSFVFVGLLVASSGAAFARNNAHFSPPGYFDPHARFPSDKVYEFGTVSVKDTKKVPYVERCHWQAEWGGIFFKNLTQVCTRYTDENTK